MTHRTEQFDPVEEKELLISKRMRESMKGENFRTMNTVILNPAITFDTQNDNEKVIILVRKSFVKNVSWIIRALIMIILPFIVYPTILAAGISPTNYLEGPVIILITFGWYLFTYTITVMEIYRWYYNALMITNERLIDIDFNPIFRRRISEANLENIEDVTETIPNFLGTMFNYGNLEIQTAAEKREFEFFAAPRPTWLRDKIMDLASIRKNILED